jgi:hypothetical protein
MDDKKIRKKCFWLGVLFLFLLALFLGGFCSLMIYFSENISIFGIVLCVGLLVFGGQYFIKKVDYYFSKAF